MALSHTRTHTHKNIPCGIMCQLSPSAMFSTPDAHCYHLGSFTVTKGLLASIRDYDFIGSGQGRKRQ